MKFFAFLAVLHGFTKLRIYYEYTNFTLTICIFIQIRKLVTFYYFFAFVFFLGVSPSSSFLIFFDEGGVSISLTCTAETFWKWSFRILAVLWRADEGLIVPSVSISRRRQIGRA